MNAPRTRITIPLREFLGCVVKVHREGGNQSTVATELGITPAAVSLRLKSLREKGVPVPELAGKRSANVAEDAASILAELGFDMEG
jgi:predicted transcriptional regulator